MKELIEKIKKYIGLLMILTVLVLVSEFLSLEKKTTISNEIGKNIKTDSADVYIAPGFSQNENAVVYYGKMRKISSGGDFNFYYYDISKDKIEERNNQYHWFWGLPYSIRFDDRAVEEYVKFMKSHVEDTLKITGIPKPDDCGYYEPGHCLKSLDIQKIEIYKVYPEYAVECLPQIKFVDEKYAEAEKNNFDFSILENNCQAINETLGEHDRINCKTLLKLTTVLALYNFEYQKFLQSHF